MNNESTGEPDNILNSEWATNVLKLHQDGFDDAVETLFQYIYYFGKEKALDLFCAENADRMKEDYQYIKYFQKEFAAKCNVEELQAQMEKKMGLEGAVWTVVDKDRDE